LDATPWLIIHNTIKWKVVASPESGPWWVVWVCVCSWFFRAPKVLKLCTNQLVVWFCKSVWIVDPLVTLSSPHLGVLTCFSYPEVLRIKEHAMTPSSIVFTFTFAFEFFKEFGCASISHKWMIQKIRMKKRLKQVLNNFILI